MKFVIVSWHPNHKHPGKVFGGNKWRFSSPNVRNGPYGGVTNTHAYYLWKLDFHWGSVGATDHGSEHTVGGNA